MTKREIEALFPKRCLITEELIGQKGVGTILLRTFVPEELWEDMFWGLSIGHVSGVRIKVEETVVHDGKKVRVPLYLDNHIVTPTEITFEKR